VQLIDLVVSPAPKPAPANTNPDTKPATIIKNGLATTINTTAWTTFLWTIYYQGIGKDDDIDISFHYSFNAFSGQSFYLPSDYLSTILGVLFEHSSNILPATKGLLMDPRATYACSQAYACSTMLRLFFDYSSTILRLFFDYSSTILRLFFDYSSTILQLFFDHSVPATKQGTPLVDILTPPAPVFKPAPAKPAPVVKTTTTTTEKAAATTSFQLFFNHSSTIFLLFFGHSSSYPLAILSAVDTASQHGAKQVEHH
jgi:hypothetical protein